MAIPRRSGWDWTERSLDRMGRSDVVNAMILLQTMYHVKIVVYNLAYKRGIMPGHDPTGGYTCLDLGVNL